MDINDISTNPADLVDIVPPEPSVEIESSSYTDLIRQLAESRQQYTPLNQFITQDSRCIQLKHDAMVLSHSSQADVILVTGQSGSGKELFAKALRSNIHDPFIAVNMAALPETLAVSILFGYKRGSFTGATEDREGAFEAAGAGTIFLDEIGDMPLSQQASLLRVLQEREVTPLGSHEAKLLTCRIIAATNRSLESLVRSQEFRGDLYARLMTFNLAIPDFSQRPDDIPLIAQHYGLLQDDAVRLRDETQYSARVHEYGVRAIQMYAKRWKTFKHL